MDWKLELVIDPRHGRRSREGVLHRQGRLHRRPRPRGHRRASVRPADAAGVGLLDRARDGHHGVGARVGPGLQLVVSDVEGRPRRARRARGRRQRGPGVRLGLVRLLRRPGRQPLGGTAVASSGLADDIRPGDAALARLSSRFQRTKVRAILRLLYTSGVAVGRRRRVDLLREHVPVLDDLPVLVETEAVHDLAVEPTEDRRAAVGRSAAASRRGRAVRMPKESSTSLGRVDSHSLGVRGPAGGEPPAGSLRSTTRVERRSGSAAA